MILVDANVFMYAAGKPSPQRDPSRRFLERVVRGKEALDARTDAEVLQEILHRYRVIHAPEKGLALFDAVLDLGIAVLPVTETGLRHARTLVQEGPRISTRDAVHVGVMFEHGISRVLSYDRGFDGVAGIERVEP
ncbi:MAG: type II toxin-antitoxin system VapC family toxin [Planctomycetota bacterium]